VIQAVMNGAAYVNLLTNKFTNGEIRAQVQRGFDFGSGFGGGRNHH
jgi:hypothetical protein